MAHKLFAIGIMWVAIIFAYIVMAFTMPAFREIVAVSEVELNASANMSKFPGTLETVQSSPVWVWFIPGTVGIVASAIILKRGEK